jgi:hypothetical protein
MSRPVLAMSFFGAETAVGIGDWAAEGSMSGSPQLIERSLALK